LYDIKMYAFSFSMSLWTDLWSWPIHYLGFAITLAGHTTLGLTPVDRRSARPTELYLTTLTTNRHSCTRRDSNPQSQLTSCHNLTPYSPKYKVP